jgi:hypothetical protein
MTFICCYRAALFACHSFDIGTSSTWRFEAELGLYDAPEQQAAAAGDQTTAAAAGEQQQQQQSTAVEASQPNAAAAAEHSASAQQQQQQQAVSEGSDIGRAPSFSLPCEQRMEQLQQHLQQTPGSTPFAQQQQQQQQRLGPAALTVDGSSGSVSFLLPSVDEAGAAGGAATPHMASVAGSGVASGVLPTLSHASSHGHVKPSSSRRELLKELMQRSEYMAWQKVLCSGLCI